MTHEWATPLMGFWPLGLDGIPESAALAAVALIGCLLGPRSTRRREGVAPGPLSTELSRVEGVAQQMRETACHTRGELARHLEGIGRLELALDMYRGSPSRENWRRLGEEADALLAPTLRMAGVVSYSQEALQKQLAQLATFAEERIDPCTGLHNRRALDEILRAQMVTRHEFRSGFGLALVNVSSGPGLAQADAEQSRRFLEILRGLHRAGDLAAHFAVDEYAVLLPQTHVQGAAAFASRLIERVAQESDLVVCVSVVEAMQGESEKRLLARAASGLHSARASGRSCLFLHNGVSCREYSADTPNRGGAATAVGYRAKTPQDASPRDRVVIRSATG